MDWDYFIEDEKFKAKRLPTAKCKVKIHDTSDLTDIRAALRSCDTIEESKREYKFWCDSYEVEVEPFEEFLEQNP